jgi:hypothetical protein
MGAENRLRAMKTGRSGGGLRHPTGGYLPTARGRARGKFGALRDHRFNRHARSPFVTQPASGKPAIGRPCVGRVAMTDAERSRRYRKLAKKRRVPRIANGSRHRASSRLRSSSRCRAGRSIVPPSVVVHFGERDPSGVTLARHVGLTCFALRLPHVRPPRSRRSGLRASSNRRNGDRPLRARPAISVVGLG